jgi:hypothetical protein
VHDRFRQYGDEDVFVQVSLGGELSKRPGRPIESRITYYFSQHGDSASVRHAETIVNAQTGQPYPEDAEPRTVRKPQETPQLRSIFSELQDNVSVAELDALRRLLSIATLN